MFYKLPVTPNTSNPEEGGTFSLLVRGDQDNIKLP
jgi:hypothetical protein